MELLLVCDSLLVLTVLRDNGDHTKRSATGREKAQFLFDWFQDFVFVVLSGFEDFS